MLAPPPPPPASIMDKGLEVASREEACRVIIVGGGGNRSRDDWRMMVGIGLDPDSLMAREAAPSAEPCRDMMGWVGGIKS